MKQKKSIYLLECAGKYKVGISSDVSRRVKELDCRPFPINVVAVSVPISNAHEQEREFHEWLEYYRISGEWFDIPDKFVQSVVQAINLVFDENGEAC